MRFKDSIEEDIVKDIVKFYIEFMIRKNNSSSILETAVSGVGTLLYHNKKALALFRETDGPSIIKAFKESGIPSLAELAQAFSEMF